MKSDMKIGILVGVVIVVILLVFFVNRDPDQVAITTPEKPAVAIEVQPEPKPQPKPVAAPIIAKPDPQPKRIQPEVILPERTEPRPELKPAQLPQPAPVIPEPEPIRQPRYHTVGEGDTLSNIAETYYGHEKFWPEIQKANHQRIKNPNHLQLGWKLRIPYPDELTPQ